METTQMDIMEKDEVKRVIVENEVDTVVHFAAYSHVDRSFIAPVEFTQNNAIGTQMLLECCRELGDQIRRFLHFSTDEVYGEVVTTATETSPLLPTNPYAASKVAAEAIIHAYTKTYHIPCIIVRGNNAYGPRQFPEKVIPKFSLLIEKGLPCTLHGDGSAMRNFIHVEDVSCAVDVVLKHGLIGEIYNIGTSFTISIRHVAEDIARVLGVPEEELDKWIVCVEDRLCNDKSYVIDSTKLGRLGWSPQMGWKDGLMEAVHWTISHKKHWEHADLEEAIAPHPTIGTESALHG
jgi:dTDP-glucose 4,6-dehydratase